MYDKKQIEANMNNPQKLWNVINQKIGKNSKRNSNIKYILDNNKKITDPVNIVEHLNKFFCNIGKKLSDKIRPPKNEKIKLPPMNSKTIFFESTNHQGIEYIIRSMQNKKWRNR